MKFRIGFLVGAVAAAVIVTNMSSSQRDRLRSTASTAVSKVKSSNTADQIANTISQVDAAAADAIDTAADNVATS